MSAHFIEEDVKRGGSNFSKFFHEALVSKGDPWKGTVREASTFKKATWSSRCITPLHCACIIPDTGPLEALLKVNPDLNIADSDKKKLVHYASACQDVGPISFLAKKGANLLDTDKDGKTPLMIACKTGRVKTANYIIEKVAEREEQLNDEDMVNKFGKGGVNRPGKDSWCPLHIAVAEAHPEVVKLLLSHGANPDKNLSAFYDKVCISNTVTLIK